LLPTGEKAIVGVWPFGGEKRTASPSLTVDNTDADWMPQDYNIERDGFSQEFGKRADNWAGMVSEARQNPAGVDTGNQYMGVLMLDTPFRGGDGQATNRLSRRACPARVWYESYRTKVKVL